MTKTTRDFRIQVLDLTEEEVEMAMEYLGDRFEFDVDFTTVYGEGYAITGIEFYAKKALRAYLDLA